jgi:hypothetical protein
MYRYLLGRCSKKEQREFEAAYLREGKLFDKLMEIEAAVIAAYRQGELSTEDRADIEKHCHIGGSQAANHPGSFKYLNSFITHLLVRRSLY